MQIPHFPARLPLALLFLSASTILPAFADCAAIDDPCATTNPLRLEIRKRKVEQIYNNLIFPRPVFIIRNEQLVSGLFEQSVIRGRVTPVGQFAGFEGTAEYFYGLAATPYSRVEKITIQAITAQADKVGIQVDIFFCNKPTGGCPTSPPVTATSTTLTQTGFFVFNSSDKVISYDLNILNLGAAYDPVDNTARQSQITQVCTLLTRGIPQAGIGPTCSSYFDDATDYPLGFPFQPGANAAYVNCVNYMNSISFGSFNRANSNTVVCREIHSLLTTIRPDVHCPHSSPGGGMTCIDYPYSSFYDSDFLNAPLTKPHAH